jgi:hypothetical protein
LRAKKRKARKFLSQQQERFSIGDDFRGDDSGMTEVNFYSSFTDPAPGGAGKLGGSSNYSGLSDADLIMQLAELEGGGGGGSARGGGEEVTFSAPQAVGDGASGSKGTEGSAAAGAAGSGSSVKAVGAGTNASAKAATELQVLEELERELGLDSLISSLPPSASNSAVKSSAAATQLSDDDNLDELERYLQSLGSSK